MAFSQLFRIGQRQTTIFALEGIYSQRFLQLPQTSSSLISRNFQTRTKGHFLPRLKGYRNVIYGIGIGGVAYGAYYYYTRPAEGDGLHKPLVYENIYRLNEPPPTPKNTQKKINPYDKSGLKITMYQYQTCPFCCKVRAYLDYFGYSYEVVEVNSITRTETKWTSYRKVPFLIVQQEGKQDIFQLKDSTLIISALHTFLLDKTKTLSEVMEFYPASENVVNGKKQLDIANKYFLIREKLPNNLTEDDLASEVRWRTWVDEDYVHVLSPNIYRTPKEAFDSFSWFAQAGNWNEIFSKWQVLTITYTGSAVMYLIGKRLKKRHGLKDDVRTSFYDSTNFLLKQLKQKGTPFLGGDKPNLADLGIYGILTAVEGCQAFGDLQANTNISGWFNEMKVAVAERQGSSLVEG